MDEKIRTIHHNRFGDIRLVKKRGIKRLTLRVEPFRGIHVSVPPYLTFQQAENFIKEKQEWIGKQLIRIKKIETNRTVFGPDAAFNTREHNLKIFKAPGNTAMFSISRGETRVYYPAGGDITDERTQRLIRMALEETWKLEARDYLPGRLRELAIKHGYQYNRISIRNNRSRWGSCSARNNINLNMHLMRLPDDLIDYVMMHELVHTRHRNHSKLFWATLEHQLPGAKEKNRQLKNFRTDIY